MRTSNPANERWEASNDINIMNIHMHIHAGIYINNSGTNRDLCSDKRVHTGEKKIV